MSNRLTTDDARQSLTAHVALKGAQLRDKYGPQLGWAQLQRVLADREFVRYPCEIVFDAAPLLTGEFAHPAQKASTPEEGFVMYVHPAFFSELDRVPWLVLYQLVLVNYGEFASADDAETFGAAALGLDTEDYYAALCQMTDQLSAAPGACGQAGA